MERCAICGKKISKWVVNSSYPEKKMCLSCLNGYVFSLNTLEQELEPIVDALSDALEKLDRGLDNKK